MATTRFLLAKYAPDLRRMEPRNIGVIVWSSGTVKARFTGEGNGDSVKPRLPKHLGVADGETYRQWLSFWRMQIQKPVLQSDDGEAVPRSSDAFLDVLRTKSRRQFMLVDGGILLDEIEPNEVGEVVDDLFETLVQVKTEADQDKTTRKLLKDATEDVLENSGVALRDDFFRGYDWVCPVGDAKQPFHFDYAIHNRAPRAVFHRVLLNRQNSIHNAAFMFDWMGRGIGLGKERCGSFVYVSDEDRGESTIEDSMRVLEIYGQVINVYDRDNAIRTILQMAS